MKVGKKKITKSGREQLDLQKQREINSVCPECQEKGRHRYEDTGGLLNNRRLDHFRCECGTEWAVDIGRKKIDWDNVEVPDAVFVVMAILGIMAAVIGLILTIEALFSGILLLVLGIVIFSAAFIAGTNNC